MNADRNLLIISLDQQRASTHTIKGWQSMEEKRSVNIVLIGQPNTTLSCVLWIASWSPISNNSKGLLLKLVVESKFYIFLLNDLFLQFEKGVVKLCWFLEKFFSVSARHYFVAILEVPSHSWIKYEIFSLAVLCSLANIVGNCQDKVTANQKTCTDLASTQRSMLVNDSHTVIRERRGKRRVMVLKAIIVAKAQLLTIFHQIDYNQVQLRPFKYSYFRLYLHRWIIKTLNLDRRALYFVLELKFRENGFETKINIKLEVRFIIYFTNVQSCKDNQIWIIDDSHYKQQYRSSTARLVLSDLCPSRIFHTSYKLLLIYFTQYWMLTFSLLLHSINSAPSLFAASLS